MKERKGFSSAPLMALGGEAEEPVDESMFSVDPAEEFGSSEAYQPHFDPAFLQSGATAPSVAPSEEHPELSAVGHDHPDDEIVDRVAQALLREYLNKRELKHILVELDKVLIRDEHTIHSRKELRHRLGLGDPPRAYSVLEQLIAQRIADAEHGSPHRLGDEPTQPRFPAPAAPSGSPPQPRSSRPLANSHGSSKVAVQSRETATGRMGLSVGQYVMSEGAVKREGGLSLQKTMLCDMKRNKVIDHLGDIDFTDSKKLGRGAGGEVCTAIHKPTKTDLAVKLVNCKGFWGGGKGDEKSQEVHKELSLLFDNQCQYIVTFHGSFFDDEKERILIAMECMSGSLSDALKDCGPMPDEVLGSVTWQCLQGLRHVHSRKIIHRDLKPQNILYNGRGEVKITDFGVSSGPVATVDDNQCETFVGTMVYMSPERLQGMKYSFSSDVWSLGLVVYNLRTGERPYPGQNGFWIIIERDPPRLPSSCGGPHVHQFVENSVRKDPAQRVSVDVLLQSPWFAKITQQNVTAKFKQWMQGRASTRSERPSQEKENKIELALAAIDDAMGPG